MHRSAINSNYKKTEPSNTQSDPKPIESDPIKLKSNSTTKTTYKTAIQTSHWKNVWSTQNQAILNSETSVITS